MLDLPVNEARMFSDNATIAAIAREVGVMDKLLDTNGLGHAVTGVLYPLHPTHYLLFGCVTGLDEKTENGLTLSALPRSRFTHDRVTQMLHDMVASTKPQG